MKAPDRIFLSYEVCDDGVICTDYMWHCHPYEDRENDEYIRADAFIKKADEFICSFVHPDDNELRDTLLKKFHEYLDL
jgi:hypothetical protein